IHSAECQKPKPKTKSMLYAGLKPCSTLAYSKCLESANGYLLVSEHSLQTHVAIRYAVARSRFFQCERTKNINPASNKTIITASSRCSHWRKCGSVSHFSPSFMPTQARAKHHGHEPANVYTWNRSLGMRTTPAYSSMNVRITSRNRPIKTPTEP